MREFAQAMQTYLMYGCLAALALLVAVLAMHKISRFFDRVFGATKRFGMIGTFALAFTATPIVLVGGSKKVGSIDSFKADECPDSVTFTWKERTEDGAVIKAVWVERRLLGATEEEAWETFTTPVPGGVGSATSLGFTLDKDYEYRAKYIYETEKAQ